MTHRPIKILADGSREYASGHRYRPVPVSERTYAVRRPDDPRAVRWHGTWLLPLVLLEDSLRAMPATRPFRDPRRR